MTSPGLIEPSRLTADMDAALSRLGDLGDQMVPTGAMHKIYAWLGRPAWLLEGVDVAECAPDLPASLTVRDDLRLTGNLLINLGFSGLVTVLARALQWPAGRLTGLLTGFAPTLGAGIDSVLDLINLSNPHLRIRSHNDGELRRLELTFERDVGPAEVVVALTFALQMYAFLQSRAAPSLGQVELGLTWDGAGEPDQSPAVTGATFRFGQPVNSVTYPAAWDALRNPMHDPLLWDMGLRMARAQGVSLRESAIVSQVRRLVTEAIRVHHRPPPLHSVSLSLGKSVRSLERSLTRAGVSFRMIVEQERKTIAAAMLADEARTIQEISDRLGFSDRTSFTRSFRTWFNVPPAAFRLQLQGSGR